MTRKICHEELVGLHCPGCGEPVHRAYVAKSYPVPGGHFRRRFCPNCHLDVTSFESVAGSDVHLLVINGLSGPQLAALRQVAKALGAKVASR